MSPPVRKESVHPRLQLGASGRPLNFTVRALSGDTVPTSTAETRTTRLRRAVASLGGHIAIFEVAWAIPMALSLLHAPYTQEDLTFGWVFWAVLWTVTPGVVLGTSLWYLVTRKWLRERSNNRWRGP